MSNKKYPRYLNIILIILCIVLIGAMGAFFLWNRKEEQAEADRLQQMAEQQQAAERAERATEEHYQPPETEIDSEGGAATNAAETETETASETEVSASEVESETETESESETESETETSLSAMGISCWGDEFYEEAAAEKYSYRAVLERLLEENGYEVDVADKTLFGAGTLSMMKMAGVPQEDLDVYIEEHQNSGGNTSVTETGIRDLTAEELDRFDRDYIPVLTMGYYGGWNNDPQELIEQEQKILDTFGENRENFLIVGIPPLDKTVGQEAYDAAMREAWGEHYISTTEVTNYSQSTPEGQEEIAQAIFDKLVELQYISK